MAQTTRAGNKRQTPSNRRAADKKQATNKNRINRAAARRLRDNARAMAGDIDYTFLCLVVLLLSIGLVMLLSASSPAGSSSFGDSYYFFKRQMAFVAIGVVGMWFVSRINFDRYKPFVPLMMRVCVIMLILVAIPFIGKSYNGARRWLPIPGIQIQPSEFMKPVIAMYFALVISQGKYNLKTIEGNVPFFAWIMFIVFLMLCEPHLSGAIIIAGIGMTLLIAGGTPIKPIALAALPVGSLGILGVYLFSPVRWNRIMSFLKPFGDVQNTSYQVVQGLYAIGSGGIFGRGLGQSIQKYGYLPEPYNDYIFAIVCEELGLIGAALIILLFAMLIVRAVRIAMNAPDTYSTLVAIGIAAQLAIQTTMNIAVATSSMPNTGVSLPFFSYGGTAIMTLLLEMGVLLNISRYSKRND